MDIFTALDAHRKISAEKLLEDLNTAVMSHTTDADGFRKYTAGLQKRAGLDGKADKPTFDESGFERMRMRMKHGI
ncbi:hypothetical protein D3C78_1462560 [compost metagenome]